MSATVTHDDLDDKADDVPAGAGYGGKELKNLPDGDYQFEINTASFAPTKKDGHLIFKMEVEVIDGAMSGNVAEIPHFLTNKDGINEVAIGILKKDLKTLGFDADEWKKSANRPLSGELTKAIPLLFGMRFKGKKVTNKNGYANLYVNERLATDGKPATFGLAELNAAAKANAEPFSV